MHCVRHWCGRAAAAVVIVLALSAGAGATTIIYPDVTMFDLDLVYDGTNFSATNAYGIVGWAPNSNPFDQQSTFGNTSITWNGSTGTFELDDLGTPYLGSPGTILFGSITSFQANLDDPGGSFLMSVLLTTSAANLGLGNVLELSIGSNNFASGAGLGDADAFSTAVPEPGTWTLLLLGVAIAGLEARRRSKRA
jgi:PEP-CTERM motif